MSTRLDRSRPPAPGTLTPFRFPPFERFELDNGITVLASHSDRAPLAYVKLLLDAGGQHSPLDRTGLAGLTAAVIDEGTARQSGTDIAAAVERWGGGLSTDTSWDRAYAAIEVPVAQLAHAVELVSDLAFRANFPDFELERVRRLRLTEIERRKHQPSMIADLALIEHIYGPTCPYGHSIYGRPESLAAIPREEVVSFYRRTYLPLGATLVAVGAFRPEELAELAAAHLGSEPRKAGPVAGELVARPTAGPRITLLDRPDAVQTELRIGCAAVSRRHSDSLGLRLFAATLGGKFTSRLNLKLREQEGLTYGVACSLQSRLGPGPFVVSAAVANRGVGLAADTVLTELARAAAVPLPEAELCETADYIVGTFPYGLQSADGVASRLEEIATFGLPDDTFDHYATLLAAWTPEAVAGAVARHLPAEGFKIVAVGPAAEIEGQLRALGEVEVLSAGAR